MQHFRRAGNYANLRLSFVIQTAPKYTLIKWRILRIKIIKQFALQKNLLFKFECVVALNHQIWSIGASVCFDWALLQCRRNEKMGWFTITMLLCVLWCFFSAVVTLLFIDGCFAFISAWRKENVANERCCFTGYQFLA